MQDKRMIPRFDRRNVAGFVIFLVALLAAPGIYAQQAGPAPKVFVLPTQSVNDSLSSIVPERIGEQVRTGVQQDNRVQLVPPYEDVLKSLSGSGHASAAIAQAEDLYTSGIGLLTAGEDARAVESFQRAVDLMEQNLADLQNYDILSDALSNLALANFNAKFDLDARNRMKDFAHLRPDAKLDPEKYDASLLSVLVDEQKKVMAAKEGRLEITANKEGAKVFIDGVEKGTAPLTVTDVGFGTHYLVVRGPGGESYSEKIRVRGRNQKQTFKAELQASSARVAGDATLPSFYVDLLAETKTGTWGAGLAPYLSELATQTGSAFVSWVLMYREGSSYKAATFVFRAQDNLVVQLDEVSFNLELSNLRAGVTTLSKNLVDAVVKFPEAKAVTEVTVGQGAVATKVTRAPRQEPKQEETKALVPPPEVKPPSEEFGTWSYVAAGGAVLVLGALIAGGVYLLVDDSNPSGANGFDAVISW